jgi:uncharacterized protein YbjT (DUF2867 family)
MQANTRIAVAGATGRVGRHIVEVLGERGHNAVAISRSTGVDVITGEGLDQALEGVDVIVDAATGPSPEEQAATEFFITAAHNLQQVGERAGVKRILVVSIIGADRFTGGYGAAKVAHERAALEGPVPALILRVSQFHEFVEQLMQWGTQGDVSYVPPMRTQLVAAQTVAEELAELATERPAPHSGSTISEIAGPREERLVEMAKLLASRDGTGVTVKEMDADPDDPDMQVYQSGALLPGPDAKLAGPTFEHWLDERS